MTREQMMAYRKQLVDHLEQCKELVKPQERFFKKYHSRLFWSLQRDLNLRVRAENGLVAGILLWMLALMVLYFVRGQMRMTARREKRLEPGDRGPAARRPQDVLHGERAQQADLLHQERKGQFPGGCLPAVCG